MKRSILALAALLVLPQLTVPHHAVAAAAAESAAKKDSYQIISDIGTWKHPTKTVFAKYGVQLKTVELRGSYPTFYVVLPKPSSLQNRSQFELFLKALAQANGYWPFTLMDGFKEIAVNSSAAKQAITGISYKAMDSYFQAAKLPAGISALTLGQAKLHPAASVDLSSHSIDARISELLAKPTAYSDGDYAAGLVQDEQQIIVSERRKAAFIGTLRIGDSMDAALQLLGKPSFRNGDISFYKTSSYYLGIQGTKTIERAVFCKTPSLADKDLLLKLLRLLGSNPNLAGVLDKNPSLQKSFETSGHIHGGGWYAWANAGLEAVDFDTREITVYNNYAGNLYQTASTQSYKVLFVDEDRTGNRMKQSLTEYTALNNRFPKEGKLSPSGKYSALYDWIYSELQYFTIRTSDHSRADRIINASVSHYEWLTDQYILYTQAFFSGVYIQPVGSKGDPVDVLSAVGIKPGDDMEESEIVSVGKSSFQIKYLGKNITIGYQIDAKGKIKLSKK